MNLGSLTYQDEGEGLEESRKEAEAERSIDQGAAQDREKEAERGAEAEERGGREARLELPETEEVAQAAVQAGEKETAGGLQSTQQEQKKGQLT